MFSGLGLDCDDFYGWIYGTENQGPSIYDPNEDKDDERYDYWSEYEEGPLESEQQELQQQAEPVIRNSGHGCQAPAYRRDIKDRDIFIMREKGYSYRKIAQQLGCSPSTIKNRIERMQMIL